MDTLHRQALLSSQFNHPINRHLPVWVPGNPLSATGLRLSLASQSKVIVPGTEFSAFRPQILFLNGFWDSLIFPPP